MTSSGIDGMVRAIRQYGKPGTRVVCFDMIPSTRQLMLDGQIDFSILQEPDKQGYEPIKILVDLLFYKPQGHGEIPVHPDRYKDPREH